MVTSLSISMKDTEGKDLQKSITYVSASASSGDLAEMAQGLTALTSNIYVSADRVQKVNVDNESIPGGSKTVPTLSVADDGGQGTGTITYTGDGDLIAYCNRGTCTITGSALQTPSSSGAIVGVICATETANYASTWAEFNVSSGGPT